MTPTKLHKKAICKTSLERRKIAMRPTSEQRRAIYKKGNIIVSAGAGSGKTTVMIERIVNKIVRHGASLSDMLIVTFTRASAADMRVKLTKRLTALATDKSDPAVSSAASAALDEISVCNIGTLHSYCQRIVKMYFYAADLDPSSVICDDSEAEAMMKAECAAAVDRALASADPDFRAIYDMLVSRKNDNNVADAVYLILSFALSVSDPVEYLGDVKPDSDSYARLDRDIAERRKSLLDRAADMRVVLAANGMAKWVDGIDAFGDFLDGVSIINGKNQIPATSMKKDNALYYLNEEYLALKTECTDLKKLADYYETAKKRNSNKYACALCGAALDAMKEYADRKKRLGKIDYSDLEHGAYKVLCDEQCLSEITEKIRYVFVDEFQDINPLQKAIVDKFKDRFAVTKGELFVVGDVKQSIYGFRRCSPRHFINAMTDKSYTHIALADNFRSSEPVIKFINDVFTNVMTSRFGGADYADPEHTLKWKNKKMGCVSDPDCGAEFVLVPKDVVPVQDTASANAAASAADSISDDVPIAEPAADSNTADAADGQGGESGDAKRIKGFSVIADTSSGVKTNSEAIFVADAIVRHVRSRLELAKSDRGGKKDIARRTDADKIGTIAVLVRSVKRRFVAALLDELRVRGVSFSLEKRSDMTDFPEVVMLVDIMRCLDNRYDDTALYTALRSPMGGLTDAQIAEIADGGARIAHKIKSEPLFGRDENSYSLWQRVTVYGKMGGDEALRQKIADFLALRDKLVEVALTRDSADTLDRITAEIDYFQYVYETGGNAQAVQSLLDYAAASGTDVHTFLTDYDEVGFEISVKSGVSTVVITTIHGAKGLEYDYVIVADNAAGFNDDDVKDNIIVSERGVSVKAPDLVNNGIVETAPYIAEKLDYPDSSHGEEMRMLYVALTRAKKRLTVCATEDGLKQVEPKAAKRPVDFMRNVAYKTWDGVIMPPDADPVMLDDKRRENISAAVAAAVKSGIEKLQKYNADRERNAVPIKASVTAIAHRTDDELAPDGTPIFSVRDGDRDFSRRGKKRCAASGNEAARRRGTAYHRAFELIDFSAPDPGGIKDDCDDFELLDEKLIVLGAKKLSALTAGAAYVVKEKYFIASLPAKELYGKGEGNALVQGIIDLMIVYPDNSVTIVDYKTGKPSAVKDEPAYKKQLLLYAKAVERAVPDYKVTRLCLYAIENGELFDV